MNPFLYFDPNEFIIFKLLKSQMYVSRAVWLYIYFIVKEKFHKKQIMKDELKIISTKPLVGTGTLPVFTSLVFCTRGLS